MMPARDPFTQTFSLTEKSSTESEESFSERLGFGMEVATFAPRIALAPTSTEEAVSEVVRLSVLQKEEEVFEVGVFGSLLLAMIVCFGCCFCQLKKKTKKMLLADFSLTVCHGFVRHYYKHFARQLALYISL